MRPFLRSILAFTVFVCPMLFGQRLIVNVPTPPNPLAITVNPVTHEIYTISETSNQFTQIDDLTYASTVVSAGPQWTSASDTPIAVNTVTNQIFALEPFTNNLIIMDGSTLAVTTAPTGNCPVALAINQKTNTIYVANFCDSTITVVDGATLATQTLGVGFEPSGIAIDPIRNLIYVTDSGDNVVTIINGVNLLSTVVPAGNYPLAVAVDQFTHIAYVSNWSDGTMTVISPNLKTTTLALDTASQSIVVDELNDKIYLGGVTQIDGKTNQVKTLSLFTNAIGVDPTRNKVYAVGSTEVTVIDGATFTIVGTVALGSNGPNGIAVDVSNHRFFTNNANNVSIFSGAPK